MINQQPSISVVMSVYNGGHYLKKAIESILHQTFTNFEFVIVNDGSTDNSLQLITKYACHDKRIRIVNQDKKGLTRSLNRALYFASGEFIARQDADDISMPDRLEKQRHFLEQNTEYCLVGSGRLEIDEKGEVLINLPIVSKDEAIRKIITKVNIFVHGSILFRANMLRAEGFYREQFPYAQDYDLILRLLEKYKVFNYPGYLYKLRITQSSISREKGLLQDKYAELARKLYFERARLCNENYDYWYKRIIEKNDNLIKKYYLFQKKNYTWNLDYGRSFLLLGQPVIAKQYIFKALRVFPSLRAFIFLMLAYFPSFYKKLRRVFRKVNPYDI